MIDVILYSRKDCHLCEVAKENLEILQESIPHQLVEIDVDTDSKLRQEYGAFVPVVKTGPYQLKAPFDLRELQVTLGAAQSREEQIDAIDQAYLHKLPAGGLTWGIADSFSHWVSKHYLAFLNILVALYVGLPFLAPVMMRAGADMPARAIYRVYGAVCHQFAFRSWFILGEQNAYPRAAAQVEGLVPYEAATGLSTDDLDAARVFIGDDRLGYKVALCERDVAIYGSILLFGVLFTLSGRRLPGLPWYIWVALGMVPIGLDGVSQLISQLPFDVMPYRESTPFLRTLTGGLFGFTTAWFGYPMVEETMADSRRYLDDKLERIKRIEKRSTTK